MPSYDIQSQVQDVLQDPKRTQAVVIAAALLLQSLEQGNSKSIDGNETATAARMNLRQAFQDWSTSSGGSGLQYHK